MGIGFFSVEVSAPWPCIYYMVLGYYAGPPLEVLREAVSDRKAVPK